MGPPAPELPDLQVAQRYLSSAHERESYGNHLRLTRMGKASRTKTDIHRRERVAVQRAAERKREQRNRLLIAGGAIFRRHRHRCRFRRFPDEQGQQRQHGGRWPPMADRRGAGQRGEGRHYRPGQRAGPGRGRWFQPWPCHQGHQRHPAHRQRQAAGLLRWRRVLPVLRGGPVGHGRVAEPLRDVQRAEDVHSSTADNPANIPTWTFYGSTYTSKYITFTRWRRPPTSWRPAGKSYTPLQTPTPTRQP